MFKKPKPVQASSLQTTNQPVITKSNNSGVIRDSRIYPLLLKKFEETGGYVQSEDYDELEAEGELTRTQILKWFCNERQGHK